MPMSKRSELQWCAFVRAVLTGWQRHDDIYTVAKRHSVPAKRVEKVVAWALRERVIRVGMVKLPSKRHGYVVDADAAIRAIADRIARVNGETPRPRMAGLDWVEFEAMWKGIVRSNRAGEALSALTEAVRANDQL